MKIISNLTLLISVFVLKLYGQSNFNKLFDYNNYGNYANSIYEYNDGGYLVSGQKTSLGGFGSLYFIRIDANGDTIYTKKYPHLNNYYYCGLSGSLIKNYENDLVITGAHITSGGNYSVLLTKLSESGDTLWTKKYGGANFDYAYILNQTTDSGFVLMGATQSYGWVPSSDFYMIKTDKNGNFEWQRTYGTSGAEICLSGNITLDGGFILSGHKNDEFYIVKTDSNGNQQWSQTYSGTSGPCFIKQLADSTYILTGAKIISGFAGQAYMIKVNKTGGIIWENHYGTSVLDEWFYTRPVILNDGSIVIGGQQRVSSRAWGLLVKTDSAGNQQWLRTYYANPTNDNYVYDVKATSDGGFILVGSGNVTGQDAWVVKVDSIGCEVSNCNVGIEELIDEEAIVVYPNPASSSINVISKKYQVQSIKIIDLLGREFYFVQNNTTEIDISQLPKGMYILQVQTEKDVVSKKWVKE